MNIYFITSLFIFSFYTLFPSDAPVTYNSYMDPNRALRIVRNLERPQLRELPETIRNKDPLVTFPYNTVVLYGEPGRGKSTIMEAVATLVGTKWKPIFITQKDLNRQPGKRGATMASFCEVIEKAEQSYDNVLILMEELHVFLNHFNSEHHDTDLFSTALQQTLDDHLKKDNMFFIATVNEFDKVAQPIKDRLALSLFEITGFGNQEAANTEFFEQIDKRNYILSDNDRAYLRTRYEGIRSYPRETKLLADMICLTAHSMRDRETGVIAITQAIVDDVMDHRDRSHAIIKMNQPVESEQQRMHRESRADHARGLEEQRRMHNESIAFQREMRNRDEDRHDRERDEDLDRHDQEHAEEVRRAEINQTLGVINTTTSVVSAVPGLAALAVAAPVVAPAVPLLASGFVVGAVGVTDYISSSRRAPQPPARRFAVEEPVVDQQSNQNSGSCSIQ